MKSRIRRKNVRKSIRRSQTGGGKTFEFQFWITNGFEGETETRIYLNITVKKPKKKTFFSKERNEYLFDVSGPLIERFARFNKKNLTLNELILLFFDNYNSDDIIEVDFINKFINELRKELLYIRDFNEEPDGIYLNGLSFLLKGLKQKRRQLDPTVSSVETYVVGPYEVDLSWR